MARKKTKNMVVVFVALILLFFIMGRSIFLLPHSNVVAHISSYSLYPVLIMYHSVVDPIKKWFIQRKTVVELVQLLNKVSAERDGLLANNIRLQALSDYNRDIKELRLFEKRYDASCAQVAQILIRHLSDQSHFFLIDVGSAHGIQVDMVALYKNCLVGKIVEVYPWYSKVQLITDSACKIAGYCTDTRAQGIHEGSNNEHQTVLQYVSHLDPIKKGDLVISSGHGLVFPRGFGLGRITSVVTNELYHAIMVKPLVNLRKIQYCLVTTKGMPIIKNNGTV